MKLLVRQGLFFICTCLLAGCSNSNTPTGPDTSKDRFIAGVNFTRLFAEPTEAEIAAVRADWASRDPVAQDYAVEASSSVNLGATQATLRVVSHTVDGAKHYGAILAPDNAAPQSLPVLIYSHGGDRGVSTSELSLITLFSGSTVDQFIYVAPSFRGEPLEHNGTVYQSEGQPSPWDRDVDDALALLNVALAQTPAADPERIGVLGASRGACVALLMAIRDARIDLVVEFFGPTDFFGEFVQQVAERTLMGSPPSLPGVDFMRTAILQPLKDGQMTETEARLEILRRSPVYFAESLPALQVHHGTADQTVPVTEAERLIEVMTALGRGEPDFQSFIYPGGTHDPLTLPGSITRAIDFFKRVLLSSAAVLP